MMIREDLAGPNSFVRTYSYLKGLHIKESLRRQYDWCDENPVLIDPFTLVPLVPLGQPEYFTSVTNFGVAGSTWRGVVLSQSIRGGRTYLHPVECAGDLHVTRIYM